ncbi:NUDIX hydrolase domain-like protein [Rhypophila decipiens]|uniref:NUDIX hydrolase domain-like protein n=1 Tax=Rhypophila decipiens TaxID=261697 RepID=A0AAN6XZK2_9PEZI|nr:NUDIX hydrolase domain-like protein [Rhypophila decipiens]
MSTSVQQTTPFPTPKAIGAKKEHVNYADRHAVRVVAFNPSGQIAIVHAKRDSYYKLPGGGIDPGEDHITAVEREMLEETGASIRVRGPSQGGCIATTEEYRGTLHQMSFCYVADVIENGSGGGGPNLTEDEINDGLEHLWVSVAEAKKLMSEAVPTSELGRFIKERDIYLLGTVTETKSEYI